MIRRHKESFLANLHDDLLSHYPQWHIDDHYKIQWIGQPRNTWPEGDLVMDILGHRFMIEYDEDSDPVRSLTKHWPVLHQAGGAPFTIIEVWKRGARVGQCHAELAKWMGARLRELYPGFAYEFIERKDETSRTISRKVAEIVEASGGVEMAKTPKQKAKLRQEVQKFLAKVPEEHVFWCHDGQVFRDMQELQSGLANMTDETFAYHSNNEKSDFSNWVRDIIKDEQLAGDLGKPLDRTQAAKIVGDRVAFSAAN